MARLDYPRQADPTDGNKPFEKKTFPAEPAAPADLSAADSPMHSEEIIKLDEDQGQTPQGSQRETSSPFIKSVR